MDEKDLKPPQLILNGRTSHCVCSPDGKWLAVLVSASSSSFALYPLSIDGVVSGSCVTLRRGLHDDGPVNSMKFDPTSSSFVYLSDQDCCISTLNVANGSASWTPLVSIGSDCEPRIGTSTFTFVADDSDSISSSRQFSLLTLSQESDSENDRRLTLLDLPRCLQLRREALQQRLLEDPSGDQESEVSYEDCSSLFAEDQLKRVPVSSMISSADGTLVAVTTISEQHQDDDEAKKLEKAESPCTTFFVFSLVSRNQWRMLFTESSSTGVLSFSPDNRWLCDGRKVWWLSQVTAHTVPLRVPSKVRCISGNDGRVFGVCFSSDSSLVFVQTHGVQCFAPSNSEPCEEAGDDHKAVAGDWRPVGEFYRVEVGEIAGLCVVASLPKAIIFSLRSGSPTPGVFWKCFV